MKTIYLGPRGGGGGIIVHIDEKHKVSVITLDFDECVTKFVRLWPYNSVQKNKFLDLERLLYLLLTCQPQQIVDIVLTAISYFSEKK